MKFVSIVLFSIFLISCSKKDHPQQILQEDQLQRLRFHNSPTMLVVDSFGTPVEGATILIGYEKDKEFTGNTLTTDASGIATFPNTWTSPLPVTIAKDGFVTHTHMDVSPSAHIFQIRRTTPTKLLAKTGKIESFTDIKKDGFIDFGLVIPSFRRDELLNLDLSKMISPELEKISVLGFDFNVPSNIFLPKQSENYGFIPFTLEKPFFKIFFEFTGKYLVSANRGRFDFKKASDKIRAGKSYFEVVNEFQFLSFDQHSLDIQNDSLSTPVQLPTTTSLATKIDFSTHVSVPQGRTLYGISVTQNNESYSILDIKMKDTTRVQLSFPQNANQTVLLANTAYEKINQDIGKISESLSTALYDSSKLNQAVLLKTIATPTMITNGLITQIPKLEAGLVSHSQKIILSHVEAQTTPSFYIERKRVEWEIYYKNWMTEIRLPKVQLRDKTSFKRWEVVFYAKPIGEENATHMVRNAVDFSN